MNNALKKVLTLLAFFLLVGGGGRHEAAAFSVGDMLAAAAREDVGKLTVAELRAVVANLENPQKRALLDDEEVFRGFVEREARRKSLLQAARQVTVVRDSGQAFLFRRQIEELLISYFVQQQAGQGKSFPSEAETRAYYEKNRDSFVLEERIHVSQIFFAISPMMTGKEVADLQDRVEAMATSIQQGELDFAAAAARYSEHEASRLNGGYLGLIKLSILLPEVGEAVRGLDGGQVSKAVRSKDGFHILKAGARVAPQPLSFEEAEKGIRQLLGNKQLIKVSQEVFDQTLKEYPPMEFSAEEVEVMRKNLNDTVM